MDIILTKDNELIATKRYATGMLKPGESVEGKTTMQIPGGKTEVSITANCSWI